MDRTQKDIQELIRKEELFLEFKGSTILITGATGLIGSMLVKAFLAANDKYALNMRIVGQIRNIVKARSVYGTLFDTVELVIDPHIECDLIIHTASPTQSRFFIEHPVETIQFSIMSTIEMLSIAKDNNASMVYLSSMEEYGVPYGFDYHMTEDKVGKIDHLNIRSSYSESKRMCECLCASYASEYDVNVMIARLAQTFGAGVPLDDNRMPMQFAQSVLKRHDIILHTEGKSVINYVYLTDALAGIITILNKGVKGEAYNICNDNEAKAVREIADLVSRDIAHNSIRVRIRKKENMGYAPDTRLFLDSSKLKELGWEARVGIIEAYKRLVTYLNENQ